jgi:hypothetical protein
VGVPLFWHSCCCWYSAAVLLLGSWCY